MNYHLQLSLGMVRESAILNAVQEGILVYSEGTALRHVQVDRKDGNLIFSYEDRCVEYIPSPTETEFTIKCHHGGEGSINYPMDYNHEDLDDVKVIAANWLILDVASTTWQVNKAN